MARRRHIIAVVEDDPGLRKALARLLTISGFDTAVFASGVEFLKSASANTAACIVAQMQLRDGSSAGLPREFEAAGVKVPILFINDQTFRKQRAGLSTVSREPAPLDRFLAAIDMAIQSRSDADLPGDEETAAPRKRSRTHSR